MSIPFGSASEEPILEVQSLCGGYGSRTVFQNVSFSLRKGDIFALLGPNGAGKSTLLRCLTGELQPLSGSVLLCGQDVSRLPPARRARLAGSVPQISGLSFGFSVRDFVVMGRAASIAFWASPSEKDYAAADSALAQLNLTSLSGRPVTELSGGERQQVLIARVLAQSPVLTVMDEPSNHLDYSSQLKILRLIRKLAASGLTVIFSTHMPDHALLAGTSVGILNAAGNFLSGAPEEMITEERLSGLYGSDVILDVSSRAGRRVCMMPALDDRRCEA